MPKGLPRELSPNLQKANLSMKAIKEVEDHLNKMKNNKK